MGAPPLAVGGGGGHQRHNEVCGIKGVGSGITSHGIRISNFSRDQGSGCTIFVGSGTKNFSRFWNQGSEIWVAWHVALSMHNKVVKKMVKDKIVVSGKDGRKPKSTDSPVGLGCLSLERKRT